MKTHAQDILDQHVSEKLDTLEIMIDDSNQKNMIRLYRDFSKMGLKPDVVDRDGVYYMVANISSKIPSNVIDISMRKRRKAEVINLQEFKAKKLGKLTI
jgi:hypothetical protein